jgi:Chalcone isomerase-like
MSRSTHWLLLSVFLLAAVARVATAETNAPPLPAVVRSLVQNLEAKGGGELTFFGMSVYSAYFHCVDRSRCSWSPELPFALQLVYHRSLVGAMIAERSVEEIAKLGYGTPDQRARWGALMKQIFPDVVDGDCIIGLNLPQSGARYYYNGNPIGEIQDREFARAFFGIWLDPRTSEPALRKKLLSER